MSGWVVVDYYTAHQSPVHFLLCPVCVSVVILVCSRVLADNKVHT